MREEKTQSFAENTNVFTGAATQLRRLRYLTALIGIKLGMPLLPYCEAAPARRAFLCEALRLLSVISAVNLWARVKKSSANETSVTFSHSEDAFRAIFKFFTESIIKVPLRDAK